MRVAQDLCSVIKMSSWNSSSLPSTSQAGRSTARAQPAPSTLLVTVQRQHCYKRHHPAAGVGQVARRGFASNAGGFLHCTAATLQLPSPPEHEPQAEEGQQAQPKAAHIVLQPLQVRAARQQPHALLMRAVAGGLAGVGSQLDAVHRQYMGCTAGHNALAQAGPTLRRHPPSGGCSPR